MEKPFEAMEMGDLIRHCVVSLCAGAPPSRRLDERVTGVLAAIQASDDLRMSVEDAAALPLFIVFASATSPTLNTATATNCPR